MKRNNDINNNYEENNITYIKFMRRKVNYRIKLLFNVLIFSGITIAASIILFLLIFNYKYKELIDKAIVTTDSYSDIGDYSKAIDNVKNSVNDLLKKSGRPGFGGEPQQIKTAGQVFLESEAFKNYQMGYASAVGWLLAVFIFVITLIQFKYRGNEVFGE